MPKKTTHPGVGVSKRKDGRYQLEWRPIGADRRDYQVLETKNRKVAVNEAEELSASLAANRARLEELVEEGVPELGMRWQISECVEAWLDRPNIKASTREASRYAIAPFSAFCTANGLAYLDEIKFNHCLAFRDHLAAKDLAAATKDDRLTAASNLLNWCKGKLRVAVNPFTIGKVDRFHGPRGRGKLRWIDMADRKRLLALCRTTQERLLFELPTRLGLRNAEIAHLRWKDYHSHVEPAELDITYSEPDEDDPEGWDPKTGVRVVPIFWPEVRELLDQWFAETPHGREPDDYIIADPTTGKPYKTLPRSLYRRLRRATGIAWSYQVGRRVACTLAVIHMESMTGYAWTQKDHEQVFGHSGATAAAYYFDPLLPRRRREEAMPMTSGQDDAAGDDEAATYEPNGLTVDLARRMLLLLIDSAGLSVLRAARTVGVSNVALGKFLKGQRRALPKWYWQAMDRLTMPAGPVEESVRDAASA